MSFTKLGNWGFKGVFITAMAVVIAIGLVGCKGKHKSINEMAFDARKRKIIEDFPKVPHDEILQQMAGNRVYGELQLSYKNTLIALKTETDYDCTKLIVVIMTPEVGRNITLANTYGIPFILKACDNLGLDCYDLSPQLATKDIGEIALFPEEGIWSQTGAAYIADLLGEIIDKYSEQRSSKDPTGKAKPAVFGDLPPGIDEVQDEEKTTRFRLKGNAQGFRMDHNITFPKRKQHILILGDDKIFNQYLENSAIATALLQKRYPDKEIINAGMPHYTMDDFESLYREKARYVEADLLIVCTDGGDILDQYFSQRNKFSRQKKIYLPTNTEEDFYDQLYRNK